jgi:nucleoside-diphosphate-sugar epimerase
LITGASGFVGGHLTGYALANGYETYAGVRASSKRTYLQDARIHIVDLPLPDAGQLTAFLQRFRAEHGVFDYVIHAAGVISATDHSQFDRINFGFTKHLADALITAGMTPKKFIYISSLSSFGSGDALSLRPLRHDDVPRPNTAYGRSKRKAEEYLYSLPAFPFIILRPTGIYGPRDRGYLSYIKMIDKGIAPFFGRRPQYITFIHVYDLVRAAFAACGSPLSRRAYFVADGDVYTTKEYAAILQRALGKKRVARASIPLWLVKTVFYTADRLYGLFGRTPAAINADKYHILSARSWICDTEPLRRELLFVPQYRLAEAVKEVIALYRRDGWL